MFDASIFHSEEYNFLRTNKHLGNRIILLGLAGSYSYGTNNEQSDIDIRGVTLNSRAELLGLAEFDQYVDVRTDTTIYSFNKLIRLLLSCNPNTLELLGLNQEHYLYLNEIGRELLAHAPIFLSKRAIQSFGGYADAQLRRLQNALARDSYPQREKEEHIYHSVKNAMYAFKNRYHSFENGAIKLYMDQAENPELDREIFMDISLAHYPLRDYKNIWNEMNTIVREYDTLGKRNKKKDDNHLNKHAMHLIRLFMMAIDLLERQEIRTYRREEHNLLLAIRGGEYQKADGTFRDEFYELVAEYEKKLAYAAAHTGLPDEPDREAVQEFMMRVNKRALEL